MTRDREDDEVAAFVRARYGRLLRTAYLLCGDHGRAEDLVQTTLAKTVMAWSRLQHSESIDHYVQRVLVNTFVSSRRRRSWWEQPFGRLVESRARDEYAGVEQRDWLRRALNGLPARQRAAIVLRFYEDLSEQDTAHALGCSVGTVKSLSSRGLQTLRARWAEADAAEHEVRYA
ncbi:putative RNA polymerase ECF-subfamily sigma factor [Actinoplanes missouriensis 431]|uniref:Putative RNA polymerase ECF-subfamily sigma factor n=1 Tax=Actinoplanes missouriensis (strain ATCC 14538 / DSM 43046 / CBS 188.64 / JCM 3121 / NBRC 102363 / NCIMB 12654 / NRRL B-3342 / UNCC 431) TaxID=512565 RepID=I0GX67_ACTM4|nr:SigE family RNA polymerase sigma factor [Actinoplanes missouriensis]BAL85354.1 putative RNA polymerase ECF-subfamily sigma factor [Actinoplanes missouriensis 431]